MVMSVLAVVAGGSGLSNDCVGSGAVGVGCGEGGVGSRGCGCGCGDGELFCDTVKKSLTQHGDQELGQELIYKDIL